MLLKYVSSHVGCSQFSHSFIQVKLTGPGPCKDLLQCFVIIGSHATDLGLFSWYIIKWGCKVMNTADGSEDITPWIFLHQTFIFFAVLCALYYVFPFPLMCCIDHNFRLHQYIMRFDCTYTYIITISACCNNNNTVSVHAKTVGGIELDLSQNTAMDKEDVSPCIDCKYKKMKCTFTVPQNISAHKGLRYKKYTQPAWHPWKGLIIPYRSIGRSIKVTRTGPQPKSGRATEFCHYRRIYCRKCKTLK